VVFDPLVEVLVPPDRFEPDAEPDLDPDASVVAAALPSVDDSGDPESVDSGASVMVPLADSERVVEAAADPEDSEGDGVSDGVSTDRKLALIVQLPTRFHRTSRGAFLSPHNQAFYISERVWPWPCGNKADEEKE
jgi:hypothetical protein